MKKPARNLNRRMTGFWFVAMILFTLFAAGLYETRQDIVPAEVRVEEPGEEPAPTGQLLGAVVGFGLFGGWIAVGGVMLARAQKAKRNREQSATGMGPSESGPPSQSDASERPVK